MKPLRLAPLRVVVAAALLGGGVAVAPSVAPAAVAASTGLSLVTTATYTLVPEAHVVRVGVDVTALNTMPNRVSGGVTTRYFFDSFRLGVQLEARSIRASSAGARLAVSTAAADGYARLEVRFARSLFLNESAKIHITFDLPGGKPRSSSEIRVGPAFATFVAWAFGDRGTVRILVPRDFETDSTGSAVTRTVSATATVFSATVTDVSSWYVVVNADRPAKLTNVDVRLRDGEDLTIRAWPDDPKWKSQVKDVLSKGLPQLVQATGLDWPVSGALSISEVHTPLLEGYAGLFFEGQNKIEVSEDLDDLTILHEASHAWFNGDLFRDRWINEGFADTYASATLDVLGLGRWNPGAVKPTAEAAVKLNDWGSVGRISDNEAEAREQFGYDASWMVVRSIVDDISVPRMRDVLDRAQLHQIAYGGAGELEPMPGPVDWRQLLDLSDEVGGSKTADRLFRTWVVSPRDLGLLDFRDAARAAYAELVRHGTDWVPPILVRRPLAEWQFDVAATATQTAETVLAKRDEVTAAAGDLGLAPPTALRMAYQTADTSFDVAVSLADRELADLAALRAAGDAVRAPRDPFVTVGLLGTSPEARLADARAAFSQGGTDAALQAGGVSALMAAATDVGRERVLTGVVAIGILIALIVWTLVLRSRRRPARRMATVMLSRPVGSATLAALPSTEPEPSTQSSSPEPPTAETAPPPRPPADTGDAS